MGRASRVTSWRVPIEARGERVFPPPLRGHVETHRFPSRALEGNPWGDPSERELPVYLPPSGETQGRPLLVLLSGYSGAGWMHVQRPRYLSDSRVGVLDRLIRGHQAPEAVLVAPDCLTTLGGSQYLNSSATGRYEDYVVQEVVPWVRERYGTGPTAVLGTSSGGYGALSLALRHPDLFRAAASNAGDALFEYTYLGDFPTAFRELRKAGDPEKFLRRVLSDPVIGFGPSHPVGRTLSTLAYASAYSPNVDEPGRFDLPFDLTTGGLREEVWGRWLALDPVRMLGQEPYRSAARRLAYLYVDGGNRDEFALDIGARVVAGRARDAGARVDHEEFDGGHFDSWSRYDLIYRKLLDGLTGGEASAAPL